MVQSLFTVNRAHDHFLYIWPILTLIKCVTISLKPGWWPLGKLQTGRFKETVLWTCELETNCSCLLNAWIIHMNVHSIPCSLIWPTGVNLLMGLHHPDSNHYCWDPQKFIQQRNFLQFKSWMYHRFLCTLKNSHWRKNNISTIFLLVTYESNYL